MRIVADRDRCIGAGMCAMNAPEVFDQDSKDGRVVLLAEQVSAASLDAVREAVESCPSGALSLEDAP